VISTTPEESPPGYRRRERCGGGESSKSFRLGVILRGIRTFTLFGGPCLTDSPDDAPGVRSHSPPVAVCADPRRHELLAPHGMDGTGRANTGQSLVSVRTKVIAGVAKMISRISVSDY
jgi:hypothetical protein